MRRARVIAVVATVAIGALGVISSTQTWLMVVLDDGDGHTLAVPGASAIPILAPLSLAVLALGAALSVVGLVLRWLFGALTVGIAALLAWLTAAVVVLRPTSAVASTVTEATGITGEAVAGLVTRVDTTPWPPVTLVGWIVLLVTGMFVLVSARRWPGSGRRYRTDAAPPAESAATSASRPHDAIDSWDDLSRGEDPTARPLD